MSKKKTPLETETLKDWRALLAGFSMKNNLLPVEVMDQLGRMPQPHMRCFQLALMGTDQVTRFFAVDGILGKETAASLRKLYLAAHPA